MLDLKPLDDKSYQQLLDDSLAELAAGRCPWTDFNAHDPGITFLETFAWLTEMQRYYIQQITERHRYQALKLIGASPLPANPARLLALVETGSALLRAGAQARIGGISYTLREEARLLGGPLTVSLRPGGQPLNPPRIAPLGECPQEGGSFYIGLPGSLMAGAAYSLYISVERCEGRAAMHSGWEPQARLCFSVGGGGAWRGCDALDGTYGLAQSGFVHLKMPESEGEYSMLRVTAEHCDFDRPPVICFVSMSAVMLEQYDMPCPAGTERELGASRAVVLAEEGQLYDEELSVRENDGHYRRWTRVGNLAVTGPHERCYQLDANGTARFAGQALSSCGPVRVENIRRTLGEGGRVMRGQSFVITDGERSYRASNPFHAEGGSNAETVEQAMARFRREHEPMSPADRLAYLARTTPGLAAKAVKVYSPEPGVVRVCVSTDGERLTGPARRNLRRRLEQARLCCTELIISQPRIWKARLSCELSLEPWARERRQEVRRGVREFCAGLSVEFGLTVEPREWRSALGALSGVKSVERLVIEGADGQSLKDSRRLTLEPDTLLEITGLELDMN